MWMSAMRCIEPNVREARWYQHTLAQAMAYRLMRLGAELPCVREDVESVVNGLLACADGEVAGRDFDKDGLRELNDDLTALFMEFFDNEVGVIPVRSMCEALALLISPDDEERGRLYRHTLETGWAKVAAALDDKETTVPSDSKAATAAAAA